ncbi:unnamed protein product [Paramecium pentaurelia]|uniref:ABC transporter family protein n=1 Tax=Paramecium pentaurelia TaxID=43138 RepID=A0A8S1W0W1_9CILI|nr:unnamed protein product [Paramecium pentaurelia]
MINTSPDKQCKRYQPIQSRYIEQVQPDETVSSNNDLDQNDQQIRLRIQRTLRKKGSIRIRNLDIDSDIIKEDISEENKSDQESDGGYMNNRNMQVAFTPNNEEEAQNPFKAQGHQYSASLWRVNNIGSQQFDQQQNGTPKQPKDHDSQKAEITIKSYKNLNSANSLYSPQKGSQMLIQSEDTIYQNFNIFQTLILYHIFSFMREMKRLLQTSVQKINFNHLPKQAVNDSIQFNLKILYQQIKNNEYSNLTALTLFKIFFWRINKLVTLLIIFLAMTETYSRFVMAILTETLISAVEDNKIGDAYIQACALALLSLLALMSKHFQQYMISNAATKIRMILINLIYDRIIELHSSQISQLNIGKIMNLVSSDFNVIEYQLSYVYQIAVIPGSLLLTSIILWLRFDGPIGLIAIIFCAILYPLQILIQKANKAILLKTRKLQDQRIQQTNTVIEGIKYIKMYVWESTFEKKINQLRSKEFLYYLNIHILNLIDRSFNFSVHIWGSFCFILFLYYYNIPLSISSIMGTIQLMSMIKYYCIFQVSYAFQALMNFSVIFQRVSEILKQQNNTLTTIDLYNKTTFTAYDLQHQPIQQLLQERTRGLNRKGSLNLQSATLLTFFQYYGRWHKDGIPAISGINLDIKSGEIVAVIGKVGSGKSTLLSAILQDIPFYEGMINQQRKLKLAYVEQDPFIYTGSIRENILFGKDYDYTLYLKVLEVSCLDQDILAFKQGDKTEIGEKGANLSGGQRARLSLARALYSMADLYLFDDPLSAVDSKVAGKIFDNAIKDFIFKFQPNYRPSLIRSHQAFISQIPSVILATHQISFALECDYVIILDLGKIIHQGPKNKIKKYILEQSNIQSSNKNIENPQLIRQLKIRRPSRLTSKVVNQMTKTNKEETPSLYVAEDQNQQDASTSTYRRYFSYWKPCLLIVIILCQNVASEIINNYYYKEMASFKQDQYQNNDVVFKNASILVIGAYVNNVIKYFLNIFGVLTSNNIIHNKMLKRLIRSPIEYFDTNPSGRLINRFSTDLSLADSQIQQTITDIFEQGAQFLVSLITIAILQPYFTFPALFTVASTIAIFRATRIVISQLKICDLISRSPLFDQFKISVYGVTQIRINENYSWIKEKFLKLSNQSMQANLIFLYSQRCFGFYIDLFGQFANIAGIFLIIAMVDDPTIFSQALLLLSTFNTQAGTLRQFMAFDSMMNSINRMFEICDIEIEDQNKQLCDLEVQIWPRLGTIQFQNVEMQYRKNTPFVLKGMNFSIKDKEKIGVVGRTGSGKSSIIQSLFRLTDIEEEGIISIDGQDIKKIALSKLRQEISIIPQVPFIFKGTLRENLDPLNKFDDIKILNTLAETGLESFLQLLPDGLNHLMDPDLFSIGQKQLICLSRVLLNKKKILVLDEATANVDMITDCVIQQIIKEKFNDCTILTIAHRLNTIADYDRIFVLEDGKVLEQGHPYELLVQNPKISTYINSDSTFAKMVLQTGSKNSSQIYGIARKCYQKNHDIGSRSNCNSKIFDVSPSSINEFNF